MATHSCRTYRNHLQSLHINNSCHRRLPLRPLHHPLPPALCLLAHQRKAGIGPSHPPLPSTALIPATLTHSRLLSPPEALVPPSPPLSRLLPPPPPPRRRLGCIHYVAPPPLHVCSPRGTPTRVRIHNPRAQCHALHPLLPFWACPTATTLAAVAVAVAAAVAAPAPGQAPLRYLWHPQLYKRDMRLWSPSCPHWSFSRRTDLRTPVYGPRAPCCSCTRIWPRLPRSTMRCRRCPTHPRPLCSTPTSPPLLQREARPHSRALLEETSPSTMWR